MENSEKEFKKELGLLDGTMLVVGSMIGSGIFIVSADIVRQVGSAGWLIAIWLLTSIITIVAAVSYGELSAMFPKAGGQYVYLKEAYNKLIAFLYGWSFFAVIQTGTIAAVGVASMRDLGISDDVVNVNGGAIALGHPIGMSGNRLALTILHELRRRGGGVGAAALCGGGGQGDALIVKTVQ